MRAERRPFLPLVVVLVAVGLNVAAAVVLKELADCSALGMALLAAGIGLVVGLNGLRFVVWGYAHKHLPLSTSYPLTSLFFPIMLAVSAAYGEPTRWTQLAGAALITAGVFWLAWRAPGLVGALPGPDPARPVDTREGTR